MQVTVLIENTSRCDGCVSEHGLSLYIETERHRVLLDAGAGSNLLVNASALGVDLQKVDTFILSHGHNDHGGGLPYFLQVNSQAPVYVRESAFEPHFGASEKAIGIECPKESDRLIRLKNNIRIDDELSLFSNVAGRRAFPRGNLKMKVLRNGVLTQDSFEHEQYLVVSGRRGNVLFSGCAHNGILNILDEYKKLYTQPLIAVFSGFHLLNNAHSYEPYTAEDEANIRSIGRELGAAETVFYTGHCTGAEAYRILSEFMPKNLVPISTGLTFKIDLS